MYLVDTNVISEQRKGWRADPGVRAFFEEADAGQWPLFLSVITIGELRRGVELKRFRGDRQQCRVLDEWLLAVQRRHARNILAVDARIIELWGHLCVPHPEHALDKLIAATALIHGLTVVTRNVRDFSHTGVRTLDPFGGPASVCRILDLWVSHSGLDDLACLHRLGPSPVTPIGHLDGASACHPFQIIPAAHAATVVPSVAPYVAHCRPSLRHGSSPRPAWPWRKAGQPNPSRLSCPFRPAAVPTSSFARSSRCSSENSASRW